MQIAVYNNMRYSSMVLLRMFQDYIAWRKRMINMTYRPESGSSLVLRWKLHYGIIGYEMERKHT